MDDFPDIAQPKTSSNDHISGNTTLKVQRTKEFVCLTSLETFFLAQLGFLELQLSVEELYRTLSERQCCFAFLLTAFYYYRAKGDKKIIYLLFSSSFYESWLKQQNYCCKSRFWVFLFIPPETTSECPPKTTSECIIIWLK